MIIKRILMIAGSLLVADCQQLNSSYYYPLPLTNKEFPCAQLPTIIPYIKPLKFNSKYGDSDRKNNRGRDQIDKDWAAKYQQQTRDIRQLEKSLSKLSMNYASGKYSASSLSNCMLDTLAPWARVNALLGPAYNHTGKSVRKWTLAAISSNFIALQAAINSKEQRVNEIKQWIDRITFMTVTEWSNRPKNKMNNHDYWAAWAVMNSAIVLDNHHYYRWSLDRYHDAMSQLDNKGLLPNELKRNSRALSYHNYALLPLVMIADLAYANGDDFISAPSAPIHSLVHNVTLGLINPADFTALTENLHLPVQNTKQLHTNYSLAWIPVYLKYHSNEQLMALKQQHSPFKSSRLGGNVSMQINNTEYSLTKR